MIVEPMVQRGLPRKDSINPLSKKQNLGILTFYKVRLFNYILIATMFPVDKIIGRAYPVFGVLFIIMIIIIK